MAPAERERYRLPVCRADGGWQTFSDALISLNRDTSIADRKALYYRDLMEWRAYLVNGALDEPMDYADV